MKYLKLASAFAGVTSLLAAGSVSAQSWTASANPTYFTTNAAGGLPAGTATVASSTATLACDVASGFWVNVPSSGSVASVGAVLNPFPSGSGLGALFCSSVKVDSTPWPATLSNKRTVGGVVVWDIVVTGVSAYNLLNQNCVGTLSGTYSNNGKLSVSGTLTGAATCTVTLNVNAVTPLSVN